MLSCHNQLTTQLYRAFQLLKIGQKYIQYFDNFLIKTVTKFKSDYFVKWKRAKKFIRSNHIHNKYLFLKSEEVPQK